MVIGWTYEERWVQFAILAYVQLWAVRNLMFSKP